MAAGTGAGTTRGQVERAMEKNGRDPRAQSQMEEADAPRWELGGTFLLKWGARSRRLQSVATLVGDTLAMVGAGGEAPGDSAATSQG